MKTVIVAPGATSIIRVYAKASNDARADQSTTFDLELINNNFFTGQCNHVSNRQS